MHFCMPQSFDLSRGLSDQCGSGYILFQDSDKILFQEVADQTPLALAGQLSRKMLERYSHARNESKRAAVKMLDLPIARVLELPTGQNNSPQFSPQSEGALSIVQM
jgi:hypothetical protein